jgi:DUF4097 and DUF4098 domain-containing protein YvlB
MKIPHATPFLTALVLAITMVAAGVAGVQDGYAQDTKDSIKRSFKVRPGGTLYLDMDHGNIEIVSSQSDMVLVEVERRATTDNREEAKRLFDSHDLSFQQSGNDIKLKSRYDQEKQQFWDKWGDRNRLRVSLLVEVPERYDIDFTSGAGNVSIDDIDGRVNGRTGAGNIVIGAVRGSISVTSGSGNIDVDGASGRLEIMTGAGNVELREVRGELEVRTGAGNIEAAITQQPEGDSRLESGAGNITVYLADEVGVYVDAVASVGNVTLKKQ